MIMPKLFPPHLTESQRSMAEALPHMVWTATPEGVVDYVNAEFEHYTGLEGLNYEAGEWILAVHPKDREETISTWTRCVESGQDYRIESRIKHKASGHYRWHLIAARPHKDNAGRVLGWYGSTVDIHSGKLSDFVIKDTELRLKRHLDVQVLETKVLDLISSGRPLQCIYDLITSAVDILLPQTRSSIVVIRDGLMRCVSAPGLSPEFCQVIEGIGVSETSGSCGAAVFRKRTVISTDIERDGEWACHREVARRFKIAACWSVPVIDSSGRVQATFGLYYDKPRSPSTDDLVFIERISQFLRVAIERTDQLTQLKANEERFRQVAKVTSDVVWECDLLTDAVWYSDGMKALFGHDPASDPTLQRASTAAGYIHPEDLPSAISVMQAAIQKGRSWKVEYRYMRRDGTYAHVVNHAYVVCDDNNIPVRLIGSVKDISAQISLQEQLRAAQRLEAVGQMTGGLAHDFNNLLTVILGNAERLTDQLPENDPRHDYAQTILKASVHGSELTSSLLAFARKQSLSPQSIDVMELVSGMESLLCTTLGEQIELSINRSDSVWPALIDPTQFKSALLNLCLNSRDAIDQSGSVAIEVSNITVNCKLTHGTEEILPGEYILLRVTDDGKGMDILTYERVFEPFFTTKEVGKGSGLGLSMVYGFIKQSNGHITIDTTLKRGTSVRIYLPRSAENVSVKMNIGSSAGEGGAGEHILLVEDDEMVRQHVESLLISLGYGVTAVANAAECLNVIDTIGKIDLLFSDIVMPGGMSGTQLANKVRASFPSLPILLTSGYAQDVFSGFDTNDSLVHLLKKPYRRSDLALMLNKVLG